jgi:hypothetical protein
MRLAETRWHLLALGLMWGLAGACDQTPAMPPRTDAGASADASIGSDFGSSMGGTGGAGGTGGRVGSGGESGSGGMNGAGGSGPPVTCASLRNCITACRADAACREQCMTAASAPAKTAYATVTACSQKDCPDVSDEGCRCPIECLADAPCVDVVDTCMATGLDNDVFCEEHCH